MEHLLAPIRPISLHVHLYVSCFQLLLQNLNCLYRKLPQDWDRGT